MAVIGAVHGFHAGLGFSAHGRHKLQGQYYRGKMVRDYYVW